MLGERREERLLLVRGPRLTFGAEVSLGRGSGHGFVGLLIALIRLRLLLLRLGRLLRALGRLTGPRLGLLALLGASLALRLLLLLDGALLRLALRALLRRLRRLTRRVVAPRAPRHSLRLGVRALLLRERPSSALEPVVRLLPLVVVHHAIRGGAAVDEGGDAFEIFAKRGKLFVKRFLLLGGPRPDELERVHLGDGILDEGVARFERRQPPLLRVQNLRRELDDGFERLHALQLLQNLHLLVVRLGDARHGRVEPA